MRYQLVFCLSLALGLSACGVRERQERVALEADAAERLRKLFWLHEDQFPNQPRTNLAQLFETVGTGYPYELHQRFTRFGKRAGFEHSFYEKYVFAPSSLSNAVIGGELILLSSEPFLDEIGEAGRVIIFRNGPGYDGWGRKWLREEVVQQTFKNSNLAIPKKTPVPPPATVTSQQRTTWKQARIILGDWAAFLGIGRSNWWLLLLACGTVVGLCAIFLFIWVGRRGRH